MVLMLRGAQFRLPGERLNLNVLSYVHVIKESCHQQSIKSLAFKFFVNFIRFTLYGHFKQHLNSIMTI